MAWQIGQVFAVSHILTFRPATHALPECLPVVMSPDIFCSQNAHSVSLAVAVDAISEITIEGG